jgi:riboflavin synthase
MFTGLIQQAGVLRGLSRVGGGWRLAVQFEPWPEPLVIGESMAVQGACLTVVKAAVNAFSADLLDETLERTALGQLRTGGRVNLERALRLGDRLGGHFVSGHIDETGRILRISRHGRDIALTVACSQDLARLTVRKGSIAIDGVSLTVVDLDDNSLSVEIIPHTWKVTSLGDRQVGDHVNLEADLIGKHVARLLGGDRVDNAAGERGGVSEALLQKAGFLE